MSTYRPKALDAWLSLTIEQREALVEHHARGCRHCRRRTSTWGDSCGNQRCQGCWGIVVEATG